MRNLTVNEVGIVAGGVDQPQQQGGAFIDEETRRAMEFEYLNNRNSGMSHEAAMAACADVGNAAKTGGAPYSLMRIREICEGAAALVISLADKSKAAGCAAEGGEWDAKGRTCVGGDGTVMP